MFLLVNKPQGITSHDVVDRVRKITGEKKVGHGGTLDPNARGLLIIGIGREQTKLLDKISKDKKKYIAEIFLGEVRDTDDAEGEIISKKENFPPPSEEKIEDILKSFLGKQKQTPPKFSAKKIKGKKAYELARKGKEVSLKPKSIKVHSIKLLNYRYPILEIETEVSSGTYIRSLARDIGQKVGSGAYLKNLNRTKVGRFSLKDAVEIDKLTKESIKNFSYNL